MVKQSCIAVNRRRTTTHLDGSRAGAHDAGASGVHLRQVVEGQDVAGLRGQVEEFECLLVVALHANAV